MESESLDALVVAPARRPAAASFDDFYLAEFPHLVPLARALCGAAAADDIAQEAMLAAYRNWRRVSQLRSPEAWVRRTCANLAVSAFRRRVSELKAYVRLSHGLLPALSPDDETFWRPYAVSPSGRRRPLPFAISTTCRWPRSPRRSRSPTGPSSST
jgi:DNA-directed RNA polymerase specialized sigma24 family protein